MDFEKRAQATYKHLIRTCNTRNEKMVSKEYPEVQKFITKNEMLISRIALILGNIPPTDVADESIRDLLGDTFDSLFTAKEIIYKGYLGTPFVLLRRAWETVSLMTLFMLHPVKSQDWRKGKEIKQSDIRKAHEKHPSGGDVKWQKEMHTYFAKYAHPNSSIIPYRGLGAGSEYTMGNFAKPEPMLTMPNLIRLIQLWACLRHILVRRYGQQLFVTDPKLKKALEKISDAQASKLNVDLQAKYDKLVREYKIKGKFK